MLLPGSLALTLLLSMLTSMGPLSVDMYLASLPDMGRLLSAPMSQVQLTRYERHAILRRAADLLAVHRRVNRTSGTRRR